MIFKFVFDLTHYIVYICKERGSAQVEEASAPEAGEAYEGVANPVLLVLGRGRQPLRDPAHHASRIAHGHHALLSCT